VKCQKQFSLKGQDEDEGVSEQQLGLRVICFGLDDIYGSSTPKHMALKWDLFWNKVYLLKWHLSYSSDWL